MVRVLNPGPPGQVARFDAKLAGLLAVVPEAPPRPAVSTDGIVIQGPVVEGATRRSVAYLRRANPGVRVIVSTWRSTSPRLLRELGPECDALVVSDPPAHSGGSNRNLQLVSTQAGMNKARELGVQRVIKMRSDCCLLAPNLFSLYRRLDDVYASEACTRYGLRGRIFVTATYTKKFFPYHVSDLVMLGHLDDLALYWNQPLDSREIPTSLHSWRHNTLETIGIEGRLPECYLGRGFSQRLGRVPKDTVEDYWQLLRDLFVVVDDSWFDLLWFKRVDPLQPRMVDEVINHQFWQCLYHGVSPPEGLLRAELHRARAEGARFDYRDVPQLGRSGEGAAG